MIHDGIDVETGEVLEAKVYNTDKHHAIKREVASQIDYVNSTIKDGAGNLARLDGDTLSMVLIELSAYYEYLHGWIADEKLHLSDLKSAYEIDFANEYLRLKDDGVTNETARMKARIHCRESVNEINKYKHGIDVIDAWSKSIARYHDTVRSQLSWTKQANIMGQS